MNTNDKMPDLKDPFTGNVSPDSTHENTPLAHDHPAIESNTYVQSHQQRQNEDALDSAAPALADPRSRGVNKKAITFMAIGGVLLAALTAFAINSFFGGTKTEKPVDEQVSIPDAPVETRAAAAPMPMVKPNTVQVDPNAKPIEVVPANNQPVQQNTTVVQNPPPIPVDPTLERRRAPGGLVDGMDSNSAPATAGGDVETGSVSVLKNRDFMLVRGTYIRCVLETRIITDVQGFTSCVTTEPVYSINGKRLLLPNGSKISGKYSAASPTGPRIGVIWDRILTPTGYDVRLRSPGVDALGGAGHEGDFRSHWLSRMGSAVLISMISDAFKYAGQQYGDSSSTITSGNGTTQTNPYDSTTAKTIQDIAKDQVGRYAARPSTVTINQGTVINIYTARDIDFSSVIQN